jgi:hypothetical protein
MPAQTLHPAVKELMRKSMDPIDFASIDIPAIIADDQGQAAINLAKYGAKWQWLNANPDPIAMAAAYGAGGSAIAVLSRPGIQGGDIEFLGFMDLSTGRYGVTPSLQTLQLDLTNTPMCNTLIFGKGLSGAMAPVSFYEPASGAINYKNVTNLIGGPGGPAGANNAEPIAYGRRFVGQESNQTVEARRAQFITTRINPFWVGPDPGQNANNNGGIGQNIEFTLPAMGNITLTCTLPTVGDFLAICPVDDSSYYDNSAGFPNFQVQIVDGLTGYQLMPQPLSVRDFVAACSLAQTNSLLVPATFDGPFAGIFTHLFARGTQIKLVFNSIDAKAILVRFGFRGALLRYKAADGRNTNTSAEVRALILSRSQVNPLTNLAQGGIS